MSWKLSAQSRLDQGIDYMEEESKSFVELLNNFNKINGLITKDPLNHGDLLQEGGMWLVELKNNKDILAEMCSYEVLNDDVKYIWVEFNSEKKELFVEIHGKDNTVNKELLLSPDEIINYYPGL